MFAAGLARLRLAPARCGCCCSSARAGAWARAAALLIAAFEVLDAGESRAGRRLWLGAALIGTAAGPAIGGVLTELFDWRAIFAVQVPLAPRGGARVRAPASPRGERGRVGAAGDRAPGRTAAERRPLVARRRRADAAPLRRARRRHCAERGRRLGGRAPPRRARPLARPLAALAFTAAAFTAVLFLLVLELVAGLRDLADPGRARRHRPAARRARRRGDPRASRGRRRSPARCCSPAARRALAFLPAPTIAWTIVPQILAGAGMGLALPALSPERDVRRGRAQPRRAPRRDRARARDPRAGRHRAAHRRDRHARSCRAPSLVLDAQIDPLKKLQLAPGAARRRRRRPPARARCSDAVDARRAEFADDAAVYDRLAGRLDDVVVGAIQDAFRIAYLIAAALALLAAALLITAWRRPAVWLAAAAAAGCVVVYAVEHDAEAPPPVVLAGSLPGARPARAPAASPARSRSRRSSSSTRRRARPASRARSSRWRSSTPTAREQFEHEHGVDPRSTIPLLSLLGG